ncbi:MAG: phosphate ABC transporter permease subunit PstC [Firmicutes bacterium]|nr:phosphate ABC transporter permease subunit PstC [Bacillota bacterium]
MNILNTTKIAEKHNKKEIFLILIFSIFGIVLPFTILAYLKLKKLNKDDTSQRLIDSAKKKDKRLTAAVILLVTWISLFVSAACALVVFYATGWFGFPLLIAIVLTIIVAVLVNSLTVAFVFSKEVSFKIIFLISSVVAIIAVFAIFFFLIWEGMPAIAEIGFFRFLFGRTWHHDGDNPQNSIYGVLPMIGGTIVAAIGALIIGGGLGVLTAICIVWFCPKKIRGFLSQTIALLAGLPSVIFGFFGAQVIVPFLANISPTGMGSGPLAVSIILGMMIFPTVVSLSKNSIEAVSSTYYEAGVALGAGKERSVFRTVVPSAKSGILASLILGVGRAVGETMAVIMVAGNVAQMPDGFFAPFRTLTVNIVLEMGYAEPNSLHLGALIASGVVLLMFVLIINIIFNLVKKNPNSNKESVIIPAIKRGITFPMRFILSKISRTTRLADDEVDEFKQRLTLEEKRKSAPKINKLSAFIVKILPMTARVISYVMLVSSIAFLGGIIIYVLTNGLGHISWQLISGEFSGFGVNHPRTLAPSIVTTLMYVLLTSIIAFPLGILTAVFLQEYTKKGSKVAKAVELAVETLAGVPSIVYGLFGMIFFVNILGLGLSITSGSIVVALMILPVTVRATQEGLKAVPDSYREASYSLGAGKVRTVFRVVIPTALPTIVTVLILGIGRMVAETASLMFTMGSTPRAMPDGYSSSGTTLAVAFYAFTRNMQFINEAFAAASILIILVLVLNITASLTARFLGKKRAAT